MLLIALLACFGPYCVLGVAAVFGGWLSLLLTQSSFVAVVLADFALAGTIIMALVVLARRQSNRVTRIAAYAAAIVWLIAFIFQGAILHGKYAIPFLALADTTTFFALALALGRPWLACAFAVPAFGLTAAHVAYSIRQIVFEMHTVGHLTLALDPCAAELGLIGPAFETGVSGLFAFGIASIAAFAGLSAEPFALWQAIVGIPTTVLTIAWGLSTADPRSTVRPLLLVGAPVTFFAYVFLRLGARSGRGSAAILPWLLWILATILSVTIGARAGWAGWIDQQISQPCM